MVERIRTLKNAARRYLPSSCAKNLPLELSIDREIERTGYNPDNLLQHSENIARLAEITAIHLGWPQWQQRVMRKAGKLHDIGKLWIPDKINCKPGPLTPEEVLIEAKHVPIGVSYVKKHGRLDQDSALVTETIGAHDEKKAYPKIVWEEDRRRIYEMQSVHALCDRVDAMISDRCYRPGMDPKIVRAILSPSFGPELVAFVIATRISPDFQRVTQQEVVLQPESPSQGVVSVPPEPAGFEAAILE